MKILRFAVLSILSLPPTVFLGTVCLLVWPINSGWCFSIARGWCRIMLWLINVCCGLRYRVEGMENLPTEPCVVYIKHSSTFETYAQLVFLPRNCWVLKKELLWIPFFGWCLVPLKAIAIDRSSGRRAVEQVIEQGKQRLADGIYIAIFPEGTRMPAGTTRRYGKSGTLLAQAAGCPIVPVAHNAGYFWPRSKWGIDPGDVVFTVGKPVDPQGRDAEDVNKDIQNWIEAEVERLAP